MGVSPWNMATDCDSVLKGRHELGSSCRPVGTQQDVGPLTTGSRPWLQNAVPLGLNRTLSQMTTRAGQNMLSPPSRSLRNEIVKRLSLTRS